MIYLDMDGVIADFFGGIEREFGVNHWKDLDFKGEVFAKLRNKDFFYNLPVFDPDRPYIDTSTYVVQIVKKFARDNEIDWGICSSPLRGDEYNSAYWKRKWLEKHGYMPSVSNCIFTSNKHKYAWSELDRKPNILIDDKPQNVKRWQDAGGIGIRFQANEDDIEYLEWELAEAMKERYE